MTVTQVVSLDKRRSKVILDEDFALVLYRGEVKKYQITEGGELADHIYREILETILNKRAAQRALYLLKSSDKTEYQLRKKLEEGGYPEEAVGYAVNFIKKHHYIDDINYGRRYVEAHCSKKSRRQLICDLQNKGIAKDLMEQIFEGQCVNEELQIRNYLNKKGYTGRELTREEMGKAITALGRKGFSYEVITRTIGEVWDCD